MSIAAAAIESGPAAVPSRRRVCGEPRGLRLPLKGLVADLAVTLLGREPAEVDRQTGAAMRLFGEACGFDRAVLYRFSTDGSLATATHSWGRREDAGRDGARRALECGPGCLWAANLRRGVEVYIPQMSQLPEDASIWTEVLEGLDVLSLALLPLRAGASTLGFVALLATDAPVWWNADALRLVRSATDVVASAVRQGQAEVELENVQRNLHTLLDDLADYLFILDSAGRVLHANPSACRRVGCSLADMRRLTAADVFKLETRKQTAEFLGGAGSGDTSLVPLLTRDGRPVSVETNLTRGQWSHQEVLFAVCRDITDRERAVDRLRRNEQRTSAILDAIPDTMLRLRADGSIRDSSSGDPRHRRRTEAGAEDELARRIAAGCRDAVTRTLVTGSMQVEELAVDADSGQRTYEVRLVVMGDDEVLAIVRDISERARLEQMKADFINRASHELRTPLTTAQLMVDLIQEGGTPDELEEYWRVLRLELHRQYDLVEDLLTVGRLETGRMKINLVPVDLSATIREAVDKARRLADSRQLTLSCDVADTLPPVASDVSAMQRVLANLLENAVKFTPAGGTVAVAVDSDADGVRIRVSDNGIGIPAEDLPQLFERFFRASNAVRAEIQGTGVGLNIVHSIVEAHGGKVSVESAIDQGTTFEIRLPGVGRRETGDGRRETPEG